MNKALFMTAGFLGFKTLTGKDRKSTAEWGFLLSALFIVPLFFLHEASELVKITLQVFWGAFVARSMFLSDGTWKKNKQR
ncbi:MAG: hypothetical protein PW844_20875 [Pantoea sp.]|uniref:hypothetical protein n=1 Tax=Pantoea sp. TaxID=69393 RepID=UPI00239761FF|nr:hypothetical protein [Pantoea sp.]MDE1188886.1 hypothetical protein [Pantoea sp.]